MDVWFKEYKNLMYATRLLGMAAGLSIILCVVREIARLFYILALGGESISFETVRHELYLQDVAIVVGGIAVWRVIILARSKSCTYTWQIVNWWLLALALSIYICLTLPEPSSPKFSDENGVSFGIYEMRNNANYVAISGILFILLSFFRLLLTATITFIRNRPK